MFYIQGVKNIGQTLRSGRARTTTNTFHIGNQVAFQYSNKNTKELTPVIVHNLNIYAIF